MNLYKLPNLSSRPETPPVEYHQRNGLLEPSCLSCSTAGLAVVDEASTVPQNQKPNYLNYSMGISLQSRPVSMRLH